MRDRKPFFRGRLWLPPSVIAAVIYVAQNAFITDSTVLGPLGIRPWLLRGQLIFAHHDRRHLLPLATTVLLSHELAGGFGAFRR